MSDCTCPFPPNTAHTCQPTAPITMGYSSQAPSASKKPWSHLDAPDLSRLDLASVLVLDIFGRPPYLVGSCLDRPDFRDVDVRIILTDEEFARLFPGRLPHPLRHLIEVAITEHYVRATGLRIDFQIQRMTSANRRYKGTRHPLGLYAETATGDDNA